MAKNWGWGGFSNQRAEVRNEVQEKKKQLEPSGEGFKAPASEGKRRLSLLLSMQTGLCACLLREETAEHPMARCVSRKEKSKRRGNDPSMIVHCL